MSKKISVLCVDDSALIRQVMTEIINGQPDLQVVGAAADPLVARDMSKALNPDVLTLDVEMPRMDGLEFLEKLMRMRPMPVVMVSSLTERGSEIAMRALELGGREIAPLVAADAQANFDCWAEQLEENWQSSHIARCRSNYFKAIVMLEAMVSAPGAQVPVHEANVIAIEMRAVRDLRGDPQIGSPPSLNRRPGREDEALYLIFFEFDSARITRDGDAVLDAVARQARHQGIRNIVIRGHADRSGSDAYNEKLSARRSEAIKKALEKRGLRAEIIHTAPRGEQDPLVKTKDGVKEQANRRGEIYFED